MLKHYFRIPSFTQAVAFFMLATWATISFNACRPKGDHYEIHGIIHNLPANIKKIYLEQVTVVNILVIDTATVKKDGAFVFDGFLRELSLCRLRFSDNGYRYIVLKNGDQVDIEMDFSSPKYLIKGSPASSSLNRYEDSLVRYNIIYTILLKQLKAIMPDDSAGKAEFKTVDTKIKSLKLSLEKFTMAYADTAENPICSIYALAQNVPSKATHYDYLKNFADKLTAKYGYLELARQFSTTLKETLVATSLKNTIKEGNIAPDIALPDKEGQLLRLSDLRGKYVLIDFWASWCKPCRSENPNLVEAYNKFKKKNFTVFSVSLDTRKDEWLQAIEADKLEWKNHVCDFKEWRTPAQDAYGFSTIPYNVLIDPAGKILAYNLHDEDIVLAIGKNLK